MMFFVCFVLTIIVKLSVQQNYHLPPMKTSPQHFPYHAYVSSDLYCLGALISKRFVLVNAICIESRKKAKVYLGTFDNPFYTFGKGQKIRSTELILHPHFAKQRDTAWANNIGLVKLLDAALISTLVRPIALPSRDYFPLRPGSFVNITGYFDVLMHSNALRYMTVKIKPQTECLAMYGQYMFENDEQCFSVVANERLSWIGPVASNGVLVGLSRAYNDQPTCIVSSSTCNPMDLFITIGNYLEWIQEHVSEVTLPTQVVTEPVHQWSDELDIVQIMPAIKTAE